MEILRFPGPAIDAGARRSPRPVRGWGWNRIPLGADHRKQSKLEEARLLKTQRLVCECSPSTAYQ
jgi:hypothetical protein